MDTLTVTNCHAERVYEWDDQADSSELVEVIHDIYENGWRSLLLVEPAGVCLAYDLGEYSCNRLAFHDGPHAYVCEDVLVTFEVCFCEFYLADGRDCHHFQESSGDGPYRFVIKHPHWEVAGQP